MRNIFIFVNLVRSKARPELNQGGISQSVQLRWWELHGKYHVSKSKKLALTTNGLPYRVTEKKPRFWPDQKKAAPRHQPSPSTSSRPWAFIFFKVECFRLSVYCVRSVVCICKAVISVRTFLDFWHNIKFLIRSKTFFCLYVDHIHENLLLLCSFA